MYAHAYQKWSKLRSKSTAIISKNWSQNNENQLQTDEKTSESKKKYGEIIDAKS